LDIVFTLFQVIACRLSARDHGLEKEVVFLLDERYQIRIPITGYDQYVLIRVLARVRVSRNIQQTASLDSNNHLLEYKSTSEHPLFGLLLPPSKRLHLSGLAERVPFVTTHGDVGEPCSICR